MERQRERGVEIAGRPRVEGLDEGRQTHTGIPLRSITTTPVITELPTAR